MCTVLRWCIAFLLSLFAMFSLILSTFYTIMKTNQEFYFSLFESHVCVTMRLYNSKPTREWLETRTTSWIDLFKTQKSNWFYYSFYVGIERIYNPLILGLLSLSHSKILVQGTTLLLPLTFLLVSIIWEDNDPLPCRGYSWSHPSELHHSGHRWDSC